jgi:hypothetical protein
MKKIIAYPLTYLFYYLGDFTSKIMIVFNSNILFNLYQTFMRWSIDIQDWAKLNKPWLNTKDDDNR